MENNSQNSTILVGMSGGVDSSVAAALTLAQGFNVIGVTMKTYNFDEVGGNMGNEASCCGLDAFNDARMVAVKLGIPHYIVDFTEAFGKEVIDNFVKEYLQGRTPNPCIICNRKIKWGELLKKADDLNASQIATGHYARIRFDENRNRYILLRSLILEKDQSYALWGLSQYALSRTLFPLGEMKKTEVRAIAATLGLKTADKEESFEICFIADNDYRRFIKERIPDFDKRISAGELVREGKVVGRHQGYPFYTIGQRSGIGAHGERVYVTEIDPENNAVTIGNDKDLLRTRLVAREVNLISVEEISDGLDVQAMVRYKDTPAPARVYRHERDKIRVEFQEPKRAITPGQSIVLFDGDVLVGGGVIESVEK
ncbi:MAG: tRNA 2-thiouridine(34) synthase MnmA [Bacteroidota bacterium]